MGALSLGSPQGQQVWFSSSNEITFPRNIILKKKMKTQIPLVTTLNNTFFHEHKWLSFRSW